MRAELSFLIKVLKHRDTLIIGYETTVDVPDGEKIIYRRLRVGKSEETELFLESGEVVKTQNGRTRLLQDQLVEDEP